jgi:hypothetical protein
LQTKISEQFSGLVDDYLPLNATVATIDVFTDRYELDLLRVARELRNSGGHGQRARESRRGGAPPPVCGRGRRPPQLRAKTSATAPQFCGLKILRDGIQRLHRSPLFVQAFDKVCKEAVGGL